MPPMDDGKWYVDNVEIPAGLTADQVDDFLRQVVKSLRKGDHNMKVQVTQPDDFVAADAGVMPDQLTAATAGGMVIPLYICHNKGP